MIAESMPTISELPMHTVIIGSVLVFFAVLFLVSFVRPAIYQSWILGRYAKRLGNANTKDLEGLSTLFKGNRILSHLWEEFKDTLHEQKDLDASGTYRARSLKRFSHQAVRMIDFSFWERELNDVEHESVRALIGDSRSAH